MKSFFCTKIRDILITKYFSFAGWVKKVGRLAYGEKVQEEMRKQFEEEKHIGKSNF